MRKPLATDYGLPLDYRWQANKGRVEARETASGCLSGLIGWIGGGALAVLAINLLVRSVGDWTIILAVFLFIPAIAGLGVLTKRLLKPLMFTAEDEQGKRYGEALEAFEYHNLETGIGFWQTMRGVAFEQAVTKLFNRRGCRAQMTKTTGDGGVDIKLSIAGVSYWCQCKGLAKPVGVAPIREIAGVCSKSTNRAVVIAINGFTKPAQDAARELGVRLVDAQHIVALARMDRIASL